MVATFAHKILPISVDDQGLHITVHLKYSIHDMYAFESVATMFFSDI